MNSLLLTISLSSLLVTMSPASEPVSHRQVAPHFWWIFLKQGDGADRSDKEMDEMQAAHIGNFKRLQAEGLLAFAGPVRDPKERIRGIALLNVADEASVMDCFKTDPYVQNRILTVTALPMTARIARVKKAPVDPKEIVENRLAVFETIGSSPSDDQMRAHWKYVEDAKEAQLCFYATSDGKGQEMAIFKGKDDKEIKDWIDADPLVKANLLRVTVYPLWLVKQVVE